MEFITTKYKGKNVSNVAHSWLFYFSIYRTYSPPLISNQVKAFQFQSHARPLTISKALSDAAYTSHDYKLINFHALL